MSDAVQDQHRMLPSVRKFLVVVDDTPECQNALRYAARRSLKTGGGVTLFYAIEPTEIPHFLGMHDIMRYEARERAEAILRLRAREVQRLSSMAPELVIREGIPREQLLSLIENDPTISILVLGASTGHEGPGPLVSFLVGQMSGTFRIPITLVPGQLSESEIDDLS